ncbi:Ribosomal RNA small subunit methyltransferase G [Acaryochloris thomasi RCC1774]|uniref:Ribosomal RNA small subunit methyltransferase G n=1 Tax=Acaryochloris thomasi RCC1774 TaxID=1764569 RepID=A0A2W1K111_9CYAN|nr:16S rRNA (guanine(527)-N(7))-methyltransferase RsmG [Acaryochloris thomasi]PZD73877.1 Ribosomal RNA small subunit methyltransferase G [Acaryochloris thomasi RCC1774]
MEISSRCPKLPQQDWLKILDWQPSPQQLEQFQNLYAQILQGNQQLNLTRITEAPDFWEKHLWDSLAGVRPWLVEESSLPVVLPDDCRVIDIGSGGGFPGLPVAIACSAWQVSLLDATRKKMAFLETVAQALGLANVKVICDRAESLGQDPAHRQQYDLALIRAVGPASVCAEYALPLLKLRGIAVLYRGQWSEDEAGALRAALEQLGGEIVETRRFKLPVSGGERHYLYLQKQQETSQKFPRRVGLPVKRPL